MSSYEFEVVSLDPNGRVLNRRKGQARGYREDLAGGVSLQMVEIPGGTFQMGSTQPEGPCEGTEEPAHTVTLGSFFMDMHAVTQAQWRAVARFPRVDLDLKADPSEVKGDNLPVTNASWEDATEFCSRLSQKTGRKYRLPSEAEWEYACRAGTSTPFHFGETITATLVNFNGNSVYGSASQGTFRERPTPVGAMGAANGFGLYDMHGNVWEWCFDPYHGTHNGAPADGGIWLEGGDFNRRLSRGGCWNCGPELCRSAFRNPLEPSLRLSVLGFRVARPGK